MGMIGLAENLGLTVEEFSELLEIYRQTTNSDLDELRAAFKAGDAGKIHEKAHSIKGSSGNLGFKELYELAREIDDNARTNSLDGLEDIIRNFSKKYKEVVEDLTQDG